MTGCEWCYAPAAYRATLVAELALSRVALCPEHAAALTRAGAVRNVTPIEATVVLDPGAT